MKSDMGVASWTRVSIPSTPPIAKNTKAVVMKRRPTTEWLTAARRCNPGPWPRPTQAVGATEAPSFRARALRPAGSLFHLPGCVGFCNRGGEVRGRMHDDVEAHLDVAATAELVAEPLVATGHISLDPQVVHVPRTASIMPANRGIQKAWMTSRLVTTTSTGTPAGRCITPSVSIPP